MMGIEAHWAEAKRRYRRELDRLKAHGLQFDNMGLVQTVLQNIDDELVCRQARHGEGAIAQAEPIQALAVERQTLEQREAWN